MTDKITVELSLKEIDEKWKEFLGTEFTVEQKITVNGKVFPGYCELLTFFRDKTEFSMYDEGVSWSYLDSCSCGAPGCSGIWEGLYIRKKKGVYYYSARKRGGYRKGILGSAKLSLRVSEENIKEIRNTIKRFYEDNSDILANDYESQGILRYFGVFK